MHYRGRRSRTCFARVTWTIIFCFCITFLTGRRQTKDNQVEGDDISEMVYHGDTEESDSDYESTEGMADTLNSSSLCVFILHPAKFFCMQYLVCLRQERFNKLYASLHECKTD